MKHSFFHLFGLLLIVLCFFLAGCDNDDQNDEQSADGTPAGDDDQAVDDDDDNDDDNNDDNDDDNDDNDDAFYPPDQTGPYPVGVTTIYFTDESRWQLWGLRYRELPLEIWYPSTGVGGVPNDMTAMVGELPDWAWSLLGLVYGDYMDSLLAITTTAMRDAEPDTADGPFPVIFFSHGISALRFQNFTLCEHLASHGFVVVAPDHYDGAIFTNIPGEAVILFNPATLVTGLIDRPPDVDFIYQSLLNLPQDGSLAASIPLDLTIFGLSGHSYGGLTSMQVGPEFDYIDAIAPLNPIFLDYYPPSFDKPFFMLQSDQDEIVGIGNDWTRGAFDQSNSDKKIHLLLKRGSHYSATDACQLLPRWFIRPVNGCDNPERIDPLLANYISYSYMTAFFKSVLLEDERYNDYLLVNHFPVELELTTQWAETPTAN